MCDNTAGSYYTSRSDCYTRAYNHSCAEPAVFAYCDGLAPLLRYASFEVVDRVVGCHELYVWPYFCTWPDGYDTSVEECGSVVDEYVGSNVQSVPVVAMEWWIYRRRCRDAGYELLNEVAVVFVHECHGAHLGTYLVGMFHAGKHFGVVEAVELAVAHFLEFGHRRAGWYG